MRTSPFMIGEPAPSFNARCGSIQDFAFSSVAGRYVALSFFGSAASPLAQQLLHELASYRSFFDDQRCSFFGVCTDPEDERLTRFQEQTPGTRFLWDVDQRISRQFGIVDHAGDYHPCTYVLDERLRVYQVLPLDDQRCGHIVRVIDILREAPPIPGPEAARPQAPILVVPRVFEMELCRALIAHYDAGGSKESGFMRDVEGRTVVVTDPNFKRRRDKEILDEHLRNAAMHRIHDRLAPEIMKAFQFLATRIERHIVACYDSTSGGHFRPHRDNTTKGTAHRRFAVSLNLNTGEYAGGLLRFPEFGWQTYTAPAGGAVVFSCSLLHEAMPVTHGRRYAYLPFLYDEAAAKVREQNLGFVADAPQRL
jgi:predicted 2-oxoglutarate/Fe(II)-dependent dioxygenase YbiX/peroxiredoxin